jgi:hypothetical protein
MARDNVWYEQGKTVDAETDTKCSNLLQWVGNGADERLDKQIGEIFTGALSAEER